MVSRADVRPVADTAKPRARRLVYLAAVVTVAVFLGLVIRFWHPVYGLTAFFQLDASNNDLKVDAFRELPVYVYRDTGGYDGLYYAQIALDPSLRDPQLRRATDNISYRGRRILPSALSWLIGVGRPSWIIAAYAIINVVGWFALAIILWRILGVHDARGWFAWAGTLFSAGALCSVRLALTDLIAATLVAGALLAAERERKRTALGCLASAALSRETALLGIVGLIKPPWLSLKNGARIVIAVLPLGGWMIYVRWRLGAVEQGVGNLSWPIVGFVEKWRDTFVALVQVDDPLLGIATLLAMVALTTQAAWMIANRELKSRWWRVGAVHVLLMLTLGTPVWEGHPGAATRILIPLTIAFNVLAYRSRAALTWLILGNLSVFAGLHAMRDVPLHSDEIATVRVGETACIARVGAGWYDREETSRHTWMWTGHEGKIELEAWPRAESALRLQFGLRSLVPRTIILRQNGTEIWRQEIGTKLTNHAVDVEVSGGHGNLSFSSEEPAVPENNTEHARALAFALYDLRVAVPNH